MSSQTVWLPTALYTALIRLQMDDFTTTECLNAVFGESEYNQAHKRRYGLVYRNLMRLVDAGFWNGEMLMMSDRIQVSLKPLYFMM